MLDNDTTDGSTAGDGFVRIPVHHDTVDHTWMVETIEGLQHELLERYDVVLVTDVDEIVAPDARVGHARRLHRRFDEWFVNCLGYEILHLADREEPFDPAARCSISAATGSPTTPTTSRRSRRTDGWEPGFHHRADGQVQLRPRPAHDPPAPHGLRDLPRSAPGAQDRAWNERDLDEGWAAHNRTVEEGEFEPWFYARHDSRRAGRSSSSGSRGLAGALLSASIPGERVRRRARVRISRRLRRVPDPIRFPEATGRGALAARRPQRRRRRPPRLDRHRAPRGGDQRRHARLPGRRVREPQLPGVRPLRRRSRSAASTS